MAGATGGQLAAAAFVPAPAPARPPPGPGSGGGGVAPPPLPPAHDAAPGGARRPQALRRTPSVRAGFVGRLAEAAGVSATAWIEGKPQSVCLRADELGTELQLFPRPDKPGGRLPAGLSPDAPMAVVPGANYAAVRVGKPVKDGKTAKAGGGLFARAPKADRTVCLDSGDGNTIVQLEVESALGAAALVSALEGLADNAAHAE